MNGASVVPVKDGNANLIPLPQRADPNAVLKLDLKLAAKSSNPSRVNVAAPIVNAPVMLAEWKLEPDTGQRLTYRKGSLTPMRGVPDVSGFAQLARTFAGEEAWRALKLILVVLALVVCALVVWRWAGREGAGRFSARHLCGTLLGLVAVLMAAVALVQVANLADQHSGYTPTDLTFLAPVQQAGSALSVEVANVSEKASASGLAGYAWPALLALVVWIYGRLRAEDWLKSGCRILGWTLLAWAALRLPNGAVWFFGVFGVFLLVHVVIPVLRSLWSLPRVPKSAPENGAAPAVAMLFVGGFLWLSFGGSAFAGSADARPALRPKEPPIADSITQQIRIEEKFALATAKIHWMAEKGEMLPLLFDPAVLTRINYPSNTLKLVRASVGLRRAQQLRAEKGGAFDMEVQYQLQVTKNATESGFILPTQYGLVNQLDLTLVNLDVDVLSPQAVSVRRDAAGSNTVAALVLSPVADAWIAWKPRSRDLKREKPVFYAEISQLYVPSAGVIEGAHLVSIRPAQGELSELILDVPRGATITDVIDP
ncbi:MAG TPA: hypothetical protein VEN28_14995, partial [Burkholderiaceae bacterium]|nr:hypothetical protein [Burkholderiaceae bacterium]